MVSVRLTRASVGPGRGELVRQDRRIHAQARGGVRVPLQAVQAHDLGEPPAGALEVLDEIEQRGRRGVVDQGHQVGDVQADGRDAGGDPRQLVFEVKSVEADQGTAEDEVIRVANRAPLHDRIAEELARLHQPSPGGQAEGLVSVGTAADDLGLDDGLEDQLRHDPRGDAPEQVGRDA